MNYLLMFSLLGCFLYPSSGFAGNANQNSSGGQVSCDENVDAADDINFTDNIIECAEEAVVTYDQTSREKFIKGRSSSLQTAENQQHDGASIASSDKTVHLPGATFIIRTVYKLGAPHLALVSLHQQMARYCPQGWELDRQWSRPIAADYYLHYEFTCL